MKYIFIILIFLVNFPAHSEEKECLDGVAKKGKAIASLEATADELHTTLTDEGIAAELFKNKCPLAQKGAAGIEEIRKNILGKNKESSDIATSFCLTMASQDVGIKARGYYKDVARDSVALRSLESSLFAACFTKKDQGRARNLYRQFRMKEPIPATNIFYLLSKFFSKELQCKGVHSDYIEGNMYLSIFERKLFKLADYLVLEIGDKQNKSNQLTIEDLTVGKDRDFLKKMLCKQRTGYPKYKNKINIYLRRFYGSEDCN